MNELEKQINQAKAYLRAMKRTGSHKQDCDNVIMHLTNIETLVNNLPMQNVVCSCYLCGTLIPDKKDQYEMFGKKLCKSCCEEQQ